MAKKSIPKRIEECNAEILVPYTTYSDINFSNVMTMNKEQFIEACYYCIGGTVPADAVEATTGDDKDYRRLQLWQDKFPESEDAKIFCRLNMLYKKGSAILQSHIYQTALAGEKAQQIQAARLLIDMKKEHDRERKLKEAREIPF